MAIIDNPITVSGGSGTDTLVEYLEARTDLRYAFAYSNIAECPMFTVDSSVTNMSYMFAACSNLTSVPKLNMNHTATTLDVRSMFSGCTNLTAVPILNFSGVSATTTYHQNIFSGCTSLSRSALNNIMASLSTMRRPTSNKTLKYVGLTEAQATTCTTLSNYSAFTAAGWTTGY